MKITIRLMLFVVFLFAVLFAGLSVLRGEQPYSNLFPLFSNLYGLGAFIFLFFSAISILYKEPSQRAFWVGSTLACACLMFVEPHFQNGLGGLCKSLAKIVVPGTGNGYNDNHYGWEKAGVVIQSCSILFLSLIAGVMTDALANGRKKKTETEAAVEDDR